MLTTATCCDREQTTLAQVVAGKNDLTQQNTANEQVRYGKFLGSETD